MSTYNIKFIYINKKYVQKGVGAKKEQIGGDQMLFNYLIKIRSVG